MIVGPRACGVCGERDIPRDVDWPWWQDGAPVHATCVASTDVVAGDNSAGEESDWRWELSLHRRRVRRIHGRTLWMMEPLSRRPGPFIFTSWTDAVNAAVAAARDEYEAATLSDGRTPYT